MPFKRVMEMDIDEKAISQSNSNTDSTIFETFDSTVNYKGKLLEYFQKKKLTPPLFDTNPCQGWLQCTITLAESDHLLETALYKYEFIGDAAPRKKLAEHQAAFATLKYLYLCATPTVVTDSVDTIASNETSGTFEPEAQPLATLPLSNTMASPFSAQQVCIQNNSTAIENVTRPLSISTPSIITPPPSTSIVSKTASLLSYHHVSQNLQDPSSSSSALLSSRNWKGDLLEYCQVLKLPFPEISTTEDAVGLGFVCRVTFTQNPVLPFLTAAAVTTITGINGSSNGDSVGSGNSLVTEQQMIDKMYVLFPSSSSITSANDSCSSVGVIASDIFRRKKEAEQHACYQTHRRLLYMLNSLGILDNDVRNGNISQTTTTESVNSVNSLFNSSSSSTSSPLAQSQLEPLPSLVDYAYSFAAGVGLTKSLRRRKKEKASSSSSHDSNSFSDSSSSNNNNTLLLSPISLLSTGNSSSRNSRGNRSNNEQELIHKSPPSSLSLSVTVDKETISTPQSSSTTSVSLLYQKQGELSVDAKEYHPLVQPQNQLVATSSSSSTTTPPSRKSGKLPLLSPFLPIADTLTLHHPTSNTAGTSAIISSGNGTGGECEDGLSVVTSVFNSLFDSSSIKVSDSNSNNHSKINSAIS